jgi:glucosamine--fructose-6-phosphate aminotransferase (isomerizing)
VNGSKMLKEIREQPEVLERVLEEGWGEVHEAAAELRWRGFRSAILAARGTSDNAALYAKYLFEVVLGVSTALASPSTFTLYESKMDPDEPLPSSQRGVPGRLRMRVAQRSGAIVL